MLPSDALPFLPHPRGYRHAGAGGDGKPLAGDALAGDAVVAPDWAARLDAAVDDALSASAPAAAASFAALRDAAPTAHGRILASLDLAFAQVESGDLAAAAETAADAL